MTESLHVIVVTRTRDMQYISGKAQTLRVTINPQANMNISTGHFFYTCLKHFDYVSEGVGYVYSK